MNGTGGGGKGAGITKVTVAEKLRVAAERREQAEKDEAAALEKRKNDFVTDLFVGAKFQYLNEKFLSPGAFQLSAEEYYDMVKDHGASPERLRSILRDGNTEALIGYCKSGLFNYSVEGFLVLNGFLRNPNPSQWRSLKQHYKESLYRLLLTMNNIALPPVLYRGCDDMEAGGKLKEVIAEMGTREEVVFDAAEGTRFMYIKKDFTSTTSSDITGFRFAKTIMLLLNLNAGVLAINMSSVSKYKNEDEILLMPNLRFRVNRCEKIRHMSQTIYQMSMDVECASGLPF